MAELERGIIGSAIKQEILSLEKEVVKIIRKSIHPVIIALALCICPGDDVFATIAASASATQLDQQIIIPESPRIERSMVELDLKI